MIKKRMMKNVLYTKNTFQVELIKIIKNEFEPNISKTIFGYGIAIFPFFY